MFPASSHRSAPDKNRSWASHRTTDRRTRSGPLGFECLEARINPGAGTFADGQFNFSVAVLFEATSTQLATIRDRFQRGSQVLADATDGGHRFGEITIVNNANPAAALRADALIHSESGRAFATPGMYGLPGAQINLYFPDDFTAAQGIDGDAYTIAHEFVHHAYGILDEYAGPASSEDHENAAPEAESATLNYSLMDDFFSRGGRAVGATYTLNELSVASNHDPDGDTWQTAYWGESDWETIANSRYPLPIPAGLPVEAPPPAETVLFHTIVDADEVHPRLVFVIDRSGSMTAFDRLTFAKGGARAVVEGVAPSGPDLALVSFATSSQLDYALNRVDTPDEETTLKNAIEALTAPASGRTNIAAGLTTGLGQLPNDAVASLANTILLLSDGDFNEGANPETVIPALKARGIAVLAIGVGTQISDAGEATLQKIARETGGTYLRAGNVGNDSYELLRNFNWYLQTVFGSTPVAESSPVVLAPGGNNQSTSFTVSVEAGASQADFLVNIEQPDIEEFHQTNVTLRSPSGRLITPAGAAGDANIDYLDDRYVKGYRVRSPEVGNWQVIAERPYGFSNRVQVQGFVTNLGTNLVVQVRDDTVAYPNPVAIEAVPYYRGEAVLGATVNGHVVRPDGSRIAVTLFDDGRPDHGDRRAGDGTYSTLFNQYGSQGNGLYAIEVKASAGVGDRTAPGEALFTSSPGSDNSVPPFTRIGSATAVVTGVPAGVITGEVVIQVQTQGEVVQGQPFKQVVQVTNQGPGEATGLFADTVVPLGWQILSTEVGQGQVTRNVNKLHFDIGRLAGGQSTTMTVTMIADRPGQGFSWAKVGSSAHPLELSAAIVASLSTSIRAINPQPQPPAPPPQAAQSLRAVVARVAKKKGQYQLRVFDAVTGARLFQVVPFGKSQGRPVLLTVDVNRDGVQDLVVGEGKGGKGRVKVYHGATGALLNSFSTGSGDSPRMEMRDINSDGVVDLIVRSGVGRRARSRILDGATLNVLAGGR